MAEVADELRLRSAIGVRLLSEVETVVFI